MGRAEQEPVGPWLWAPARVMDRFCRSIEVAAFMRIKRYEVDFASNRPQQLRQTPGIILQHFNADPNCPRFSEVLADDPGRREVILQASRETPIYVDGLLVPEVEVLLPYLPDGRFLLEIVCDPEETGSVLAMLSGSSRRA